MLPYKHILITGANGTLAPFIIKHAEAMGIKVTIWDRTRVSIDDQSQIEDYTHQVEPDAFYHIATGDPEWIRGIIKGLKSRQIPLIFTSTESVFADDQEGPFAEETLPLSESDYGKYKRTCEAIINADYKDHSTIVRLGWQIGLKPEKNNMLTWLKDNSPVHASDKWIPSTTFMPDTAKVLLEEVPLLPKGTYHLDGNHSNLSFYQIATRLNQAFSLDIEVIQDDSFVHNNRLLSRVLHAPGIDDRLK